MIKKVMFIFFSMCSLEAFSQGKMTADQAINSNDPQVIAAYIKNNPNDPKSMELRQKLTSIVLGSANKGAKPQVAMPKKTESSIGKVATAAGQQQKTEQVLNHLFNSNESSSDAYVEIVNKSECSLIMKFSGKKNYNLTVPAKNKNYILLEKGNYSLSTNLCDAGYSSVKNINKDMVITLNTQK